MSQSNSGSGYPQPCGNSKPPQYVTRWAARFRITGIWMGWWFKDGKLVKPAPPVER